MEPVELERRESPDDLFRRQRRRPNRADQISLTEGG